MAQVLLGRDRRASAGYAFMIASVASMVACVICGVILLQVLRRDRLSLGLPFAYLIMLLLNHLPGAWADVVSNGATGSARGGIILTAIGCVFFLAGVIIARWLSKPRRSATTPELVGRAPEPPVRGQVFWVFCLVSGWTVVFGLNFILQIPSVGAVVEKGAAIWMLGVTLGLRYAVMKGRIRDAFFWASALMVYPAYILLFAGFLSYGTTAVVVVASALPIVAKRSWTAIAGVSAVFVAGVNIFVNYFAYRTELRDVVWHDRGSMGERLDVIGRAVSNFTLLDPKNPDHILALDRRMNQNHFISLAQDRLQYGEMEFLYGRSVWEGVLALVPRAFWPDKPVFGGSGDLVREATGLDLNRDTSWGVGNVLEFYINYGYAGVIVGFLLLGLALGYLDRKTATSLRSGRMGDSILFFLPAVALIQPIGSLVEMIGGAAAAFLAAVLWRFAWRFFLGFGAKGRRSPGMRPRPRGV